MRWCANASDKLVIIDLASLIRIYPFISAALGEISGINRADKNTAETLHPLVFAPRIPAGAFIHVAR